MSNSKYENSKFSYQLTRWYKNQDKLGYAIAQIEQYFPHSEGKVYITKRNNTTRQYAVFTDGKEMRREKVREFGNYLTPFEQLLRGRKTEGVSLLRVLFGRVS